ISTFSSFPLRAACCQVYPQQQFAFALLYFTGSDYFNRSMRFFAKVRGLTLSDKGLAIVLRQQRKCIYKGTFHFGKSCRCDTEADIFAALGLEYRSPRQRSVDENFVQVAA
ncbi:unnamed protein product, partial [Phaeothamnion confervicola]